MSTTSITIISIMALSVVAMFATAYKMNVETKTPNRAHRRAKRFNHVAPKRDWSKFS